MRTYIAFYCLLNHCRWTSDIHGFVPAFTTIHEAVALILSAYWFCFGEISESYYSCVLSSKKCLIKDHAPRNTPIPPTKKYLIKEHAPQNSPTPPTLGGYPFCSQRTESTAKYSSLQGPFCSPSNNRLSGVSLLGQPILSGDPFRSPDTAGTPECPLSPILNRDPFSSPVKGGTSEFPLPSTL